MTPFAIQITLLSPTGIGSGDGRAGVVDREVVTDDLGLPLIPARRLKGALREAVLDVRDALAAFGQWNAQFLLEADELFGGPGMPAAGPFQLGDASLLEYANLREWTRGLRAISGGAGYFHPDAVLSAFSELRAQTAMDARTGGPQENSLRVTRLLRSGLQFTAHGALLIDDATQLNMALKTLCLGCGALRHLGMSRNRGPGEVRTQFVCTKLTWSPAKLAEELTSASRVQEAP